jgi:hypothetical protein
MIPVLDAREELHEFASENAQIKVSVLLQTFGMPGVDEAQIHRLLLDAITNTYVAGYAGGWDASIEKVSDTIQKIDRYQPR